MAGAVAFRRIRACFLLVGKKSDHSDARRRVPPRRAHKRRIGPSHAPADGSLQKLRDAIIRSIPVQNLPLCRDCMAKRFVVIGESLFQVGQGPMAAKLIQSVPMMRHGTPTAVAPAGMLLLTSAPAPMMARSPISRLVRATMFARIPM